MLSVTVQTPVANAVAPVVTWAVNAVEAVLGLVIVMVGPEAPDSVHANVYGGTPPVALTVVELVVIVPLVGVLAKQLVGDAVAMT